MSVATFRPIGRLGNNIFQAAACIAYAKQYGMSWALPDRRGNGDNDPWLMSAFWPTLPVVRGGGGHRYEQHDVAMFNYKPIPHFPGGVTLVGFFQSERWFANAAEEVRAAFTLKHYPEYEGYVSIHVRRGDYVTNSNSFPPVTLNYIEQAIFKLPATGKYLIFSDEIDWCKYQFRKFPYQFEYNQDAEFEALSKMASCSYHIIANSSFSWWGAWLGHNPSKIIVSPDPSSWFGPGFTGSTPVDLIPGHWIKIKFR